MNIVTSGRTDIHDFFEQSGIRTYTKLSHTPLLVFITNGDTVTVQIVHKPADLLTFTDDTKVMGQWRGQYRSDFFQFTVGQLREHLAINPKGKHNEI